MRTRSLLAAAKHSASRHGEADSSVYLSVARQPSARSVANFALLPASCSHIIRFQLKIRTSYTSSALKTDLSCDASKTLDGLPARRQQALRF
ncbi:hypothetical protein WJX73_002674 [Symbiochloris irregularis]|uniref:Uncharacterized protein n=1 Tax=Symbiochloris irregularis TaxID=706552 RepID=A0AAW1NKU9_9CHLO